VKTIEDLAKAGRLGPRAPFVRCVTALLSPSLLRSPDVKQPPFSLFRKLREHSSWLPSCVTRCVDCVDNTVVDAAFLPRLDVHRRALRLQLCPNGVYRNYFLCERSLLFVPEWFAPPQPETWPLGLSQVGWPLEPPNPRESNPEPPTAPSIPDALTRWLQETAPKYARTIVFFCGTGNPRHAPDFFAAAVAIVARMNKSYRDRDLPAKFRVIVDETKRTRAVFLTSHPETLPVGEFLLFSYLVWAIGMTTCFIYYYRSRRRRDRRRVPLRVRRPGRAVTRVHRHRARRRRRDRRGRGDARDAAARLPVRVRSVRQRSTGRETRRGRGHVG
jgi:hypothetical protein